MIANRAAQQSQATCTVTVANLLASDDPGVLGLGAPADCRQFTRAKSIHERRIAEYRIHTTCERVGALGEALIRAFGVSANEQDRIIAGRRSERTLQRNTNAELPVLAISDAWQEAASSFHCFRAQQQLSAIGKQVAHQKTAQNIARCRTARGAPVSKRAWPAGRNS